MKPHVAHEPLADLLDRHTAVGAAALWHAEGERIRCVACGHRCLIGDGLRGTCKVRFNDRGQLRVPFGYVAGLQCDPVEKKPFFHVHPGSDALTFGMMGCDYHCLYCQNWLTSQALRDASAVAPIRPVTPVQLVELAQRERARLVVSSYNEPLITAEWSVSVFREATAAGLACAFVSNGNATAEALDFLRPWLSAYKVDLKGFDDRRYRTLGGTLESVQRTIRMVHERGLWLEVVTLVIPGFNDDPDELRRAAAFLASVSPDIPWHLTAFHPDYKMTGPGRTPAETLMRAAEVGVAEGLRFVYVGNLPGQVGNWENTRCPSCHATVVERFGYLIRSYQLTPDGRCPHCRTQLPGVWPVSAADVRTGNDMTAYRNRLPRAVPTPQVEAPAPRVHTLPIIDDPAPPRTGGPTAMPAAPPAPLTDELRTRLIAATARMLRHAAAGQTPAFPADEPELHGRLVAGAYVSLKRGRHLRACTGMLGQAVPLPRALEQAVSATVWDDTRFPPVSVAELDHLEMEVWLLDNPQPVRAAGEDRLSAVQVGRHGIQVMRDQARGLFLPGVAVENNWDARRFLDRVCVKAGLHPTAWQEETTALFTFEGAAVRGRCGTADGPPAMVRKGVCRPEDFATYAAFCRKELANLLNGTTPSYYVWGAPDGNVNGIVLTLSRPGLPGNLTFSQISLRPGVPLQSTLFGLVRAAAQQLAAQGATAETVDGLEVGLTLLDGPALHGTVADPHLAGLDPRRQAVLVLERQKAGLVFDPQHSASEMLKQAAAEAQVMLPETALVVSLEALPADRPLRVSTAPRAVAGPAVRPAAVAGMFYEADPAALARTVDQLLAGERKPEHWPAVMVPHAALKYSGAVAAAVLRRLHIPQTIIVIGPKHTALGVDWAVAPHERWALPGGGMNSDTQLVQQLCAAIPGLERDAAAHQREHAIEVELPLLARLSPESRVIGIAIGQGDLASAQRFADGLARVLREHSDRPLLLVSSDMNHFAPDAATRRLDELALAALERGDPAELYDTVTENNISMCGVLPAVIALETLRLLGQGGKAERVAYATTADVTGDHSRVVGYAGVLLG